MTKTFDLTEDNHCEIITAERERFIIYDDNVKQLIFLTPTAVTGEITETHEDISCLTFELDERLNLNIWRELCSSVYCEGKQLTEGEYWDSFRAVHEENIRLKQENQELKHRISETAGMEFQLLNRDIEQLQKEIKDIEKAKDDFYDKVFRLIDEKIDECTIMECDCSDCAGSQLLKELKEELKS